MVLHSIIWHICIAALKIWCYVAPKMVLLWLEAKNHFWCDIAPFLVKAFMMWKDAKRIEIFLPMFNKCLLWFFVGFLPSLSQIWTLQELISQSHSTTGDQEKVKAWDTHTTHFCRGRDVLSVFVCVNVQCFPVHASSASLQPLTCPRHPNRRGWWEGKEL